MNFCLELNISVNLSGALCFKLQFWGAHFAVLFADQYVPSAASSPSSATSCQALWNRAFPAGCDGAGNTQRILVLLFHISHSTLTQFNSFSSHGRVNLEVVKMYCSTYWMNKNCTLWEQILMCWLFPPCTISWSWRRLSWTGWFTCWAEGTSCLLSATSANAWRSWTPTSRSSDTLWQRSAAKTVYWSLEIKVKISSLCFGYSELLQVQVRFWAVSHCSPGCDLILLILISGSDKVLNRAPWEYRINYLHLRPLQLLVCFQDWYMN